MTNDDAQHWIGDRYGRSALHLLRDYVDCLIEGNREQNLISRATAGEVWVRHIADSVQLARHGSASGPWLDVGSGAGLPGLVVAIVSLCPMILCEPRTKRASFLNETIVRLGLSDRVTVRQTKVETLRLDHEPATISARAVASLPVLFAGAWQNTIAETVWVLPRGLQAQSEVAEARRLWQGVFHVERSLTDPRSGIVIARGVRPR